MGNYVFRECSALREIVVDEANTVYDSRDNCNAIIETATNKLILGCVNTKIPNTVTSIGSYAFAHCENVGKIVIPDSVVSIEQFAFNYCSNIIIELVSDITDIDTYAFYNNENILIHCLPDSNIEANATYNGIEYKYIINGAEITLEPEGVVYNGTSKTPSVKLVAGETILEEGTDYEVTYSDNINAGTATVTITGKGNYVGTIIKTFEIEALNITEATLGTVTYTYDGKAKTPSVTVKSGAVVLVEGTDYIVTYSNNTNAGIATVTITGKGNYAGTLTKTFTIKEVSKPAVTEPTVTKPAKVTGLKQLTSYAMKYIKLSWTKVSDAKGYEIYRATSKNGTYKLIKTTTKTSFKNEKLADGKNYFYKVRAYKVVDGKKVYGDFSSVKKMITKSKAPVINVKRTTKTKAKLTWKKVTGAEGYEVYMKTGKNGKYKKVTILNAKKVAYTKAKLKKGTKYSFKVRTYRKVGNKKIYSEWSKVKSV